MAKVIINLNKVIVNQVGKEIKKTENENLTVRDVILNLIFNSSSDDITKTVRKTTIILPALNTNKSTVELEDSDYELVENAIKQNKVQYLDGILGQIIEQLNIK